MNIDLVLIIPHYNDEEGLIDSLKSVQFDGTLQVLVVDDGSLTKPQLKKLKALPLPIKVLQNGRNLGIAKTLNRALFYTKKQYKPTYIARLDCGDTCINDRLNKQFEYLETYQQVSFIGSYVYLNFVDKSEELLYKVPVSHEEIAQKMNYNVGFIHPSIMFRSGVLDLVPGYPENFLHGEDYAFFYKVVKLFRTANIPEPLVRVVLKKGNITTQNRRKQALIKLKIISEYATPNLHSAYGIIRNTLALVTPERIIHFFRRKAANR